MTYLHIILRPLLFSFLAVTFLFVGCADPVPDDYTEEVIVEGFAITGRQLDNIRVYRSLPIKDTFTFEKAMIRDAEVFILEGSTPIPTEFVLDSLGGRYRAVDTTYLVKANTQYDLEVRTRGRVITGSAKTQPVFNWIKPPKDTMTYPGIDNELKTYDSLNLAWEAVPGAARYIVAMECLDTLNYGSYLTPTTTDANRRLKEDDFIEDGSNITRETTRYGFVIAPSTAVVWLAFKWFGKQRIHVYVGDKNFSNWFTLVGFGRRSQYDYRLGGLQGGLGVWGGATPLEAETFLLKDKP